ncbi:MAG: mannose-6-phosphate isomerase, class I [Thermoflexales bacterium]|nr:mannose-6-phosphate isomerase, class I [Thermoflexales bacterium]
MSRTAIVEPRPYLLVNKIQPYAWGTRGKDAFIPRLLGMQAEDDCPYAELWMGTHPNAPSAVILAGGQLVSLCQLIEQAPAQVLGQAVAERFGGALPFLFKVLSAAEALSIQVHPNQEQARVLHARDPLHYPDDNHKPEVAVALDALTALVGFKPLTGIAQTLATYPELATFIGEAATRQVMNAGSSHASEGAELVRLAYATLLERSVSHEGALLKAIAQLRQRLGAQPGLSQVEQLFLDLCARYADAGLFSIFFLNLVHLEKGQGVYLKAGVPHAYLRGNIVECMANSDNVVRVGLTPKFKDAAALIDILDYEPGVLPILEGAPDAEEIVYRAPVSEFQLSRWRLGPGCQRHETTGGGVHVLLVTEGELIIGWGAGSQTVRRGQSILIPVCLGQFTLQASIPAEVFAVSVA